MKKQKKKGEENIEGEKGINETWGGDNPNKKKPPPKGRVG